MQYVKLSKKTGITILPRGGPAYLSVWQNKMLPPYAEVIDIDRIITLHSLGLRVANTIGAPPNIDCLRGALGNAWNAEEYRRDEAHASPGLLFGCYLLSYLAKDHCAPDGNKRMAWLAFVEVLAFYDLEVNAEDEEVERFCNQIINDNLGGEDVAEWVIEKLIELTDLSPSSGEPPPSNSN